MTPSASEVQQFEVFSRCLFLIAPTHFYGKLVGCSSSRGTEGSERKALGVGISPHGGSAGQTGVECSIGDIEIWLNGSLRMECLSLWDLCEGNLEGGLPCWGP